MVSNRQSDLVRQGRCKIPIHQESRRIRRGDTKQASIRGLRNVTNSLWTNDRAASYLETFLRKVVREVVEHKIQDHPSSRARVNEAGISGAKPLQLIFTKKLPDTIYTQSNIIAEDESPLQIALFDVRSQSIVTDGPFSSLKVEICVLKSDEWNEDEFNSNILGQREGKQPLLVGERFITLKNGVGYVSKIFFTDNSRWQKSRKFRLGVRVVEGSFSEANVKEGRSQPFKVMDYRGESYKKHYPPFLNDDIWRLKKIAKDGKFHKRLSQHGIHTVKDLLRLYITNESSLYEKFGKIPKKSWLAVIEHAKTCVIDDYKLYSYHTAEHPISLLFNCIYMLMGVAFYGQNYCSPDTLAPSEKHLVDIMKQHAYKNVNNLKPVDEASLNSLNLAAFLKALQSNISDQGLQHINISTAQDQPETLPVDEGIHDYQIYADPQPNIREMPQNSPVEDEFPSGICIEGDNSWYFDDLDGSYFPFLQEGYPIENENLEFINGSPPYTTTWEAENNFFFSPSDGAEFSNHSTFLHSAVDITSSGKPKAIWYKIRTALKWVLSARRDVAARNNSNLFNYDYY